MYTLGVILARAGSKGLLDKCVRSLLGRPVIEYTFDHALDSGLLSACVLTTDSEPAKALARIRGIQVIDRPPNLASDSATVDAAARHAVEHWEQRHGRKVDAVVLLYGNIPVRADGLIDRAIEHLRASGGDSVRSVAPVTKQHPDWVHRLDADRMSQFRPNSIYRRQDLEPLYYHDGAVAAVTRAALFGALATPQDYQSFLGKDRRAIVCQPEDAVDIDGPIDLALAEALMRARLADSAAAPPLEGHTIRIGDRLIGPTQGVFVIAEAGVNHNGSLRTALQMIDAAAQAGADAVKFQMFCAAELASTHAATVGYQKTATEHDAQRDMLQGLELADHEWVQIKSHCDQQGILFLATPFGPDDVRRCAALGAPAIKIASTDLTHTELLNAAAATDLPLIVSTGAATASEIDDAVSWAEAQVTSDRLVLLHCVSAYPAPLEGINLGAIAAHKQRFGLPVGFSDHTTSTLTGAMATSAGACVIEKHFTLDKNAAGPDHAMSLSPDELTEYISLIRVARQARGTGRLGLGPQEREVREAARRSLVARHAIARGTPITRSMLALKRPGTGIPPRQIDQVVGRVARQDIPDDAVLTWDMVQ